MDTNMLKICSKYFSFINFDDSLNLANYTDEICLKPINLVAGFATSNNTLVNKYTTTL